MGYGDIKMAWGCEGHVGARRGCRRCGKIPLLQHTSAKMKINVRVPYKKGDASDR